MADDDKRHIWSLLPERREANEEPPVQHRRVVVGDPGSGNS